MTIETPQHIRRLGKRELGRHAFEERMPDHIARMASDEDDQNTLRGVIPQLARLLSRDSDVETAYLCTEHAVQVYKLPEEGAHFCGYRNMQMLCLAIGLSGREKVKELDLHQKLSVQQLQNLIEGAWDLGINAHGRLQTGGIKGTRKHVGTSEAEALLLSLDIPCTGTAFEGKGAWSKLLDFVEEYFASSTSDAVEQQNIFQTSRPPIFLQRPRHSVTIVGLVKLRSGKRRILIFDPAWRPPATAMESKDKVKALTWKEVIALRRYSKSERYLKRFSAFETLTVASH